MISTSMLWMSGMAAGLVAAMWRQLQFALRKISGLLIVRESLEDDELIGAVMGLLWAEGIAFGGGDRAYAGSKLWVAGRHNAVRLVPFERGSLAGTFFLYKGRPVLLTPGSSSGPGGSRQVIYIRGSFAKDELVNAGLDRYDRLSLAFVSGARNRGTRFVVSRLRGSRGRVVQASAQSSGGSSSPGDARAELAASAAPTISALAIGLNTAHRVFRYTRDELIPPPPAEGSPLDVVALPEGGDAAVAAIRHWYDSREWYAKREIAWRFGVGLVGKPGNGKSVFARAIARELGIPIFTFDLASMDNGDFVDGWSLACKESPSVALFEDIDAVYDGRENVSEGRGPSFDCFLNALGGVEPPNGVLTIITTNKEETLDPALFSGAASGGATRPGRVDVVLRFGPPSEEGRRQICERICDELTPEERDQIVRYAVAESGAQFEAWCREVALARHWSKLDAAARTDAAFDVLRAKKEAGLLRAFEELTPEERERAAALTAAPACEFGELTDLPEGVEFATRGDVCLAEDSKAVIVGHSPVVTPGVHWPDGVTVDMAMALTKVCDPLPITQEAMDMLCEEFSRHPMRAVARHRARVDSGWTADMPLFEPSPRPETFEDLDALLNDTNDSPTPGVDPAAPPGGEILVLAGTPGPSIVVNSCVFRSSPVGRPEEDAKRPGRRDVPAAAPSADAVAKMRSFCREVADAGDIEFPEAAHMTLGSLAERIKAEVFGEPLPSEDAR